MYNKTLATRIQSIPFELEEMILKEYRKGLNERMNRRTTVVGYNLSDDDINYSILPLPNVNKLINYITGPFKRWQPTPFNYRAYRDFESKSPLQMGWSKVNMRN